MRDLSLSLIMAILAILVLGAIYINDQSLNDCEAAGGRIVYSTCIDREVIIKDY